MQHLSYDLELGGGSDVIFFQCSIKWVILSCLLHWSQNGLSDLSMRYRCVSIVCPIRSRDNEDWSFRLKVVPLGWFLYFSCMGNSIV